MGSFERTASVESSLTFTVILEGLLRHSSKKVVCCNRSLVEKVFGVNGFWCKRSMYGCNGSDSDGFVLCHCHSARSFSYRALTASRKG